MFFFRFKKKMQWLAESKKQTNKITNTLGEHSGAVGKEVTIHTAACRNLDTVTKDTKVIDRRR